MVAHGALDRFLATDCTDFTDEEKTKGLILLGIVKIFVEADWIEPHGSVAGIVGSFQCSVFSLKEREFNHAWGWGWNLKF